MEIGAILKKNGQCEFRVWAPLLNAVQLHLIAPIEKTVDMVKDENGYWKVTLNPIEVGTQYFYRLNDEIERPDPASRFQKNGVHQASVVIDYQAYQSDKVADWQPIPFEEYIIYELHVGTFTEKGDFEGVIEKLNHLKTLGITAVEIMPVAQCPGCKNWGYDGVYPYAVQNNYGGPDGLKKLVNACHQAGLAVILDVVYNHLGPEGNYLADYGPYFSHKYHTPWGKALNFDDRYSDEVRNYFFENADYWFRYFDIDALRLDAIDTIYDEGITHFLKALSEQVYELSRKLDRRFFLIAESDLNDRKIIKPVRHGGYGIDAQWNYDFHRALHVLLTGEINGFYADFGKMDDLINAYQEGFVLTGQYSHWHKRKYGMSSEHVQAEQFVVCNQTHDIVGNRLFGERLCHLVSYEATKLAASIVLLSPYVPLLFMGEEYGETNPFCYFIDHSDSGLIEAVNRGRREMFHQFNWHQQPPAAEEEQTFLSSKLNWQLLNETQHQKLFEFYQTLIQLRKAHDVFKVSKLGITCFELKANILCIERRYLGKKFFLLMNFNPDDVEFTFFLQGTWQKVLDSSESQWLGSGSNVPTKIKDFFSYVIKRESFMLFQCQDRGLFS